MHARIFCYNAPIPCTSWRGCSFFASHPTPLEQPFALKIGNRKFTVRKDTQWSPLARKIHCRFSWYSWLKGPANLLAVTWSIHFMMMTFMRSSFAASSQLQSATTGLSSPIYSLVEATKLLSWVQFCHQMLGGSMHSFCQLVVGDICWSFSFWNFSQIGS